MWQDGQKKIESTLLGIGNLPDISEIGTGAEQRMHRNSCGQWLHDVGAHERANFDRDGRPAAAVKPLCWPLGGKGTLILALTLHESIWADQKDGSRLELIAVMAILQGRRWRTNEAWLGRIVEERVCVCFCNIVFSEIVAWQGIGVHVGQRERTS